MKVTNERLETYWKNYQLRRVLFPRDLESRAGEFVQAELAGKAIAERERAAVCFYAYLRGCLEEGEWRTPGEWEEEQGEELPAGAAVWIRWVGNETWKPEKWGDAKRFSRRVLEVLVCRGPEEPPRPEPGDLKAERKWMSEKNLGGAV